MKLVDLNPQFFSSGGAKGAGMFFDCPCGCKERRHVAFLNPISGERGFKNDRPMWNRTGDKFNEMTTKPSIYFVKEKGGCGWHGFLNDGVFRSC